MRLLPKANHFFDELEQHVGLIDQSAQILLEALQSASDLADAARRIKDIERECDQITRNIVLE
jgi:uncharacterized protein Yka (UPF0111/DUF47 family)